MQESYPCCHEGSVIKKRLALSKQVLLLSARHFYIRRPIPPPPSLFSFSLVPLRSSSPSFLTPLDCMPSGHACRRINREPFKRSEWSLRWQDQQQHADSCHVLTVWRVLPGHRNSLRTLDELLDSCVAHLVFWATKTGSNALLGQVKAAARLHRIRPETPKSSYSCYTQLTFLAPED